MSQAVSPHIGLLCPGCLVMLSSGNRSGQLPEGDGRGDLGVSIPHVTAVGWWWCAYPVAGGPSTGRMRTRVGCAGSLGMNLLDLKGIESSSSDVLASRFPDYHQDQIDTVLRTYCPSVTQCPCYMQTGSRCVSSHFELSSGQPAGEQSSC